MINKNLLILSIGQTFSYTSPVVNVLLSGIIGSQLNNIIMLSTLPTALMVVGTAIGSLFASKIMSIKGRKFGFILSSLVSTLACLLCAFSIYIESFFLYSFGNLIIGLSFSFVQLYRFAASENVSNVNKPRAISLILLLGILATILGSNIVSLSKDIFFITYVGSYVTLSILNFIPFLFFIFYDDLESTVSVNQFFFSKKNIIKLLSNNSIKLAISSSAIGFVTMSLIMTATPLSMHLINEFSLMKTSIVIQLHSVGMFLPSLFTAELIKRFGHRRMLFIGIFVMFSCIGINFFLQTYYSFMIALILLGVGWNFLFITGTSLLVISYDYRDRFIAQGLNDFIVFTTQALGALLAGVVLFLIGWKILNLICIPFLLIILFFLKVEKNIN